ncbi:hypothetical protein HK099_003778 [Clydaea vesicula]|uniref:Uncharacterized protein n=1 Tax=Clydaea vesicula TaxID=447962 RepID=A0AAD5U360_9FUNG|nr:hypothetical protein HK099_003778 [Clydaea vesicula]
MTETIVKKTKFEWNRSYSSFTEDQAVARIKKDFADIFNSLVQIEELVDFSSVTHKTVNIKDTLYEDLCICIEVEDFPGAATKSSKEVNVNDMVFLILVKIKRENDRAKESGGFEEFVIVDTISEIPEEPILVVDSQNVYDISNKPSYGILSTGVSWSFIKYSDNDIVVSEEVTAIFPRMSQQKKRWFDQNSKVIDIIYKIILDNQNK